MNVTTYAKRAIIYTRFSPRPDAETSQSCEKQEERCRAYCERMGYQVMGVCADKDITGGILDRPKLRKAIQFLRPGWVLVIDAGDRLARDMLVELTIHAEVERAECAIEYADGSPTRSTPEGNLFRNMMGAFAQYERERVVLRTKRGLKKKRDNGEWQGKPPIGYQYDKRSKTLIEHPGEQIALAYLRQLPDEMNSVTKAKWVTSKHGPIRGKPWSARTVRKILASR
jgi:DNA invertase Pin-like site-specific DNA recombinase